MLHAVPGGFMGCIYMYRIHFLAFFAECSSWFITMYMYKFKQTITGIIPYTCMCIFFVYRQLKLRQEAVSELTTNGSPSVSLLRECILRLPDLERMLCSAYHKKVLQSSLVTCIDFLDIIGCIMYVSHTCLNCAVLSVTILYLGE